MKNKPGPSRKVLVQMLWSRTGLGSRGINPCLSHPHRWQWGTAKFFLLGESVSYFVALFVREEQEKEKYRVWGQIKQTMQIAQNDACCWFVIWSFKDKKWKRHLHFLKKKPTTITKSFKCLLVMSALLYFWKLRMSVWHRLFVQMLGDHDEQKQYFVTHSGLEARNKVEPANSWYNCVPKLRWPTPNRTIEWVSSHPLVETM